MSVILNWIISTSYNYFTDLGSISNTISEKALGKSAKTLGKSFLSSLGRLLIWRQDLFWTIWNRYRESMFRHFSFYGVYYLFSDSKQIT